MDDVTGFSLIPREISRVSYRLCPLAIGVKWGKNAKVSYTALKGV
jgi:hypothetical protein